MRDGHRVPTYPAPSPLGRHSQPRPLRSRPPRIAHPHAPPERPLLRVWRGERALTRERGPVTLSSDARIPPASAALPGTRASVTSGPGPDNRGASTGTRCAPTSPPTVSPRPPNRVWSGSSPRTRSTRQVRAVHSRCGLGLGHARRRSGLEQAFEARRDLAYIHSVASFSSPASTPKSTTASTRSARTKHSSSKARPRSPQHGWPTRHTSRCRRSPACRDSAAADFGDVTDTLERHGLVNFEASWKELGASLKRQMLAEASTTEQASESPGEKSECANLLAAYLGDHYTGATPVVWS